MRLGKPSSARNTSGQQTRQTLGQEKGKFTFKSCWCYPPTRHYQSDVVKETMSIYDPRRSLWNPSAVLIPNPPAPSKDPEWKLLWPHNMCCRLMFAFSQQYKWPWSALLTSIDSSLYCLHMNKITLTLSLCTWRWNTWWPHWKQRAPIRSTTSLFRAPALSEHQAWPGHTYYCWRG